MNRTGFSALWSHWLRHPGQLLTLVLGLSLATALWSGVQAINAEAKNSYAAAAASLGQNELEILTNPSGPVPQQDYIALRRAGWAVSPVVEGRLDLGGREVRILGIEPVTAPLAAQIVDLSRPGVLAQVITGQIGFAAPDTIVGLNRNALPLEILPVASLAPGQVVVDIGTAQRLLMQPDALTRLVLSPEQAQNLAPLTQITPHLVRSAPQTRSDVASLTDSFHLNLTAFGMLAFVVGLFIVYAAIGLAFEQRRPMLRTLRALGMSNRSLIVLLLVEVSAIALISGVLGIVLGYVIASLLLPDVAATLRGLYGADVATSLSLRPIWWASGIGIALVGAVLASAQSMWRLAKMPVLAPALPQAWLGQMRRGLKWQAGLAVAAFCIAVFAIVGFDGLFAGFVMLACVLLGSALALPIILAALLSIGERSARHPLAQWFWADTRQQLPGLSLALMALMLALATNIGVGTMVSSFRQTFVGWLDQRLVSEFYVTARRQDEATRLGTFLNANADAVLPIWRVEAKLQNAPAEVYAIADHATYRDNWPLLTASPEAWDSIARGTGVLINEQLWRRSGLGLGEPLQLTPTSVLPIVGVYSDYGNPKGQAMIGEAQFIQTFPTAPRLGFAIRIAPTDVPALRRKIVETFGLPDSAMIDQAAIKAFSLGVFERTFSVSAALNVLTLGVAGFAMLTSLMTLAVMRLPQIAPIWALGLSRGTIAGFELLRAAILAAMTALVAIPVGLFLAWSLLAVVNVEAFGWRLPMFLYPAQWAILAALSLLAAVLASAWPVLRLMRLAPSDLLKVFAHER